MEETALKSLKSIGISAKIVTGLIILGVAATIYKNYYELKKTKLQIKFIEQELDLIKNQLLNA